MKKPVFSASLFTLLFTLCFAFVAEAAFPTVNPVSKQPRWEKLGERKVNYGLDRDEILVTAAEGRFTALKFLVQKGGINLHKVAIHYGNGEVQEIETRNDIPAGGESRVINLPGNRRVIRKVVFWYDTKNYANQKASVELWGRH